MKINMESLLSQLNQKMKMFNGEKVKHRQEKSNHQATNMTFQKGIESFQGKLKEDINLMNASKKKPIAKSPPKKKPSALASIYSSTIEKKRMKSRGKLISRKGF